MPQANFTYNGENYIVDSGTSPPSLWRMASSGPVLLSQTSPGWNTPELRTKMQQALQTAQGGPPTPPADQAASGGGQQAGPQVRWKTDPSLSTGGYLYDATNGQPLPPQAGTRITNKAGETVTWDGTQFVPEQAAPATPAGGTPDLATVQKRVLGSMGRGGWDVTGDTPEIKNQTTTDRSGVTTTQMGPTGNRIWVISGPGGKNDTVTVRPSESTPGDFEPVVPPDNITDRPAVGGPDTGWYVPDAQGVYQLAVPPHTPNADEEVTKAVARQVAESERNERAANELAGKGYVTANELSTMTAQAATSKLGQDTLAQRIVEFGRTQKNADLKQASDDKVAAQNILQSQGQTKLIGAQTSGTEATTAATQQTTELAKLTQPTTIEQGKATLAGTQANTASVKQAMQVAGAPTLQGGLTNPYLTTSNPLTGAIDQSQMNLAYQPKTPAEIAARVGQIQALMQQKGQEIQGRVDAKTITHEQGLAEFNQWYAQNVASQQQSLQAAQDQAAFDRGQTQMTARTAAQTAALGAGTGYTNAFDAEKTNRVGPRYDEVMAQLSAGKPLSQIDTTGATTYRAPNPTSAAQAATMQALKYIDPTAAAASGAPPPNYNAIDINAAFAPSQYMPGAGGPPPGGPQTSPTGQPLPTQSVPPPPMLAPGMAGVAGMDPRLAGQSPAPPPMPFGAIGPNPWANSMYQFGG